MKYSKRSVIWEFFEDLPNDEKSPVKICKLCKNKIKTSGNTTNARSHLLKHHPIDLEKAESKIDVLSGDSSSTDEANGEAPPLVINTEESASSSATSNADGDGTTLTTINTNKVSK